MTESDSSWAASADLIAQLKTAIGQRDMERDPFVHQRLSLRVVDLQYQLAEINSAETVRLEARESPIADAWLDHVARQADVAVDIRDHSNGLSSKQVRDRDSARVACVLAVPALLAEIRRLRQEQERMLQACGVVTVARVAELEDALRGCARTLDDEGIDASRYLAIAEGKAVTRG